MASSSVQPDAQRVVERLLEGAVAQGASDVHLEPVAEGYEVRVRVDGLLRVAERIEVDAGRAAVARLMVMAQLLTYRRDVPQEGRFAMVLPGVGAVEMRLAVVPTTHGLRATVRMPADLLQPQGLGQLGCRRR